jgi:hypothetical protein
MKYAIEMAPSGMIYISSFMKIGTGIEESSKVLDQQCGHL